ncbi:hypothetical protein WOSG25_110290 [Weissella oryzae SG25]|uniref:Uncharacterized protein n=1 Tax=Weissella oryzae (strain DSM 25784 / JCM 18191 / LMG 30913 / SG25) TaxID=1329250 RepID=A0A069D2B0_WEIOS|nr:hypothetical protein [Weissella oryzae]GAK31551.1 hypothetical protein WOSG25_110290 [Weissella oryzae SG25]
MSLNSVSPETFSKNNNKEQMEKAFSDAPEVEIPSDFKLPVSNKKVGEVTKSYSVTLFPSDMEKLIKLAEQQGFGKNRSAFLQALIRSL